MDTLLHLLHSDGADRLKLCVGEPPVVVLDGQPQNLLCSAITTEEAEQLFQSIADTRQRRELRDHGRVEFLYRFRDRASFVVHAKMEGENIHMEIH